MTPLTNSYSRESLYVSRLGNFPQVGGARIFHPVVIPPTVIMRRLRDLESRLYEPTAKRYRINDEGERERLMPFEIGELRALIFDAVGDLVEDATTLVRLRLVCKSFYTVLARDYNQLGRLPMSAGDHASWTFSGPMVHHIAKNGVRDPRFEDADWLRKMTVEDTYMFRGMPKPRWRLVLDGYIEGDVRHGLEVIAYLVPREDWIKWRSVPIMWFERMVQLGRVDMFRVFLREARRIVHLDDSLLRDLVTIIMRDGGGLQIAFLDIILNVCDHCGTDLIPYAIRASFRPQDHEEKILTWFHARCRCLPFVPPPLVTWLREHPEPFPADEQ